MPAAVVVLWHGRGPGEAHVLRRLATALHSDGHTVVTPNWDASAADRGAAVLRSSLEQASAIAAEHPSVPLVLVGWSLGGTAALSLALASSGAPRPAAVVGLAADVRERSPLNGALPGDQVSSGIDVLPIFLVHGADDAVVPAAGAEEFARACLAAGIACTLTVVESDHAGVLGTEYDPRVGICVPSDGPAATRGLDAALQAVRAAVRRH